MIRFFERYRLLTAIIFYLLWGASFFANVFNLEESQSLILTWSCNVVIFIFWLIVLLDMILMRIKDRFFWILSMVLLPFFAPVVYLFRRKNLIHLENNKFKSSRRFR